MATKKIDPSTIQIREATLADVPSLTSIEVRSFHPTNAFHRHVFPDTPVMRAWWEKIFIDEVNDPQGHAIIAVDPNASPELQVIGTICLRLLDPEKRSAGMYTETEWTADHDMEMFQPSIDVMCEWREKLFKGTGQWHYLIELTGVDHEYKALGIGKMILEKVFEIADARGFPVFVEANGFAQGWYKRFGFEEKGRKVMEGKEEYVQHVLVRDVPAGRK